LFRRQKNHSATMKEMSAIAPPTVPPTIAPKLGDAAGAVVGLGDEELVLVGVGVLEDDVDEGVAVTASTVVVGVLLANAPIPVSIGVGPIEAVVVTDLARIINEVKLAWLGGLIAPTIPTLQWDTGLAPAQKYQIGALTLVIVSCHDMRGPELLDPVPQ